MIGLHLSRAHFISPMMILRNTKYIIKMLRRSLLLRVLLNTRILVPSTAKRCLHIARGLVNAAIPIRSTFLQSRGSGQRGSTFLRSRGSGQRGNTFLHSRGSGQRGSTFLQSQGSLDVRERKYYIAGLVAATAVVTEALKPLVSQHPPCEDYC